MMRWCSVQTAGQIEQSTRPRIHACIVNGIYFVEFGLHVLHIPLPRSNAPRIFKTSTFSSLSCIKMQNWSQKEPMAVGFLYSTYYILFFWYSLCLSWKRKKISVAAATSWKSHFKKVAMKKKSQKFFKFTIIGLSASSSFFFFRHMLRYLQHFVCLLNSVSGWLQGRSSVSNQKWWLQSCADVKI